MWEKFEKIEKVEGTCNQCLHPQYENRRQRSSQSNQNQSCKKKGFQLNSGNLQLQSKSISFNQLRLHPERTYDFKTLPVWESFEVSGDPLSRCNCPLGNLLQEAQSILYKLIGYVWQTARGSAKDWQWMEPNLHLGWDDWLIESVWMVLPLLALLLLLLAERCSLLVGCQDVCLQFLD